MFLLCLVCYYGPDRGRAPLLILCFLSTVNGRMVPLNEVMEEDQRNMTTEEYKVIILALLSNIIY